MTGEAVVVLLLPPPHPITAIAAQRSKLDAKTLKLISAYTFHAFLRAPRIEGAIGHVLDDEGEIVPAAPPKSEHFPVGLENR
jgi:hypothetical protein